MLHCYMPLLIRRYVQAVTGITMIGIGVAFNYMANKEITEARRQARKKKHMLKRRGRLDWRTNRTGKRK